MTTCRFGTKPLNEWKKKHKYLDLISGKHSFYS